MKKQQWLLGAGLLVMIVLLIGASFLYNSLAVGNEPENLVIVGTTTAASTTAASPTETSPDGDPATETTDGIPAETTDGIPAETTVPTPSETTTEAQNSLAPDFTVTDRNGNPVKLSDLRGKPVFLNFWASWCGPCKSEMPALEEAYLKYGQDIHFLLVNVTDGSHETVESARSYVDSQGYTFPIYFDTTLEASILYGASAIPLSIFIDAQGNLTAYASGALTSATLQKGIDMIYPK